MQSSIEQLQLRLDAIVPGTIHEHHIKTALHEAIAALREGNYGIGALATSRNRVLSVGRNRMFFPTHDLAHHAEHDVLHNLKVATGRDTFKGVSIYTSLEPTCPICLLSLLAAGIKKVYYPISVPASENLMIEAVLSEHRIMRHRVASTTNSIFEAIPVSAKLAQLGQDIFLHDRAELDEKVLDQGGFSAELTHLNLHPSEREALKVRPNTGLPADFIQGKMVVCTGEDPRELVHAMQHVFPGERPEVHSYRCYYAWKYTDITVVISGIGTGCLEPMMFELLDQKTLGSQVAKRLAMIGTAGFLADSGFGEVYLVDGAYPVGCAVTLRDEQLPVRPNFPGLEHVALTRAEEISTDYYYAATPSTADWRKVAAKEHDPALSAGLEKHWKPGRLISMETAQFYHFAHIYGDAETQYAAFRGVANLADKFDTQGNYSQLVLTEALQQAVNLLRR